MDVQDMPVAIRCWILLYRLVDELGGLALLVQQGVGAEQDAHVHVLHRQQQVVVIGDASYDSASATHDTNRGLPLSSADRACSLHVPFQNIEAQQLNAHLTSRLDGCRMLTIKAFLKDGAWCAHLDILQLHVSFHLLQSFEVMDPDRLVPASQM